jgi:hypothetical protein
LQSLLQSATYPIDILLAGKAGELLPEQQKALKTTQMTIQRALELVSANPLPQATTILQSENG